MPEALKLAQELRSKNISVEFDLSNKKFNKQLEKAAKYAKKSNNSALLTEINNSLIGIS